METKLSASAKTSENDAFKHYKRPYLLNGEIFEIISMDGSNVTVKCCHCPVKNIYRGSMKSTGNFHMHIKRKHPHLIPRIEALKLASMMHKKDASKYVKDLSLKKSRKSTKMSAAATTSGATGAVNETANANATSAKSEIHRKNHSGGHKLENIIQTKLNQNMFSSQSVNTRSNHRMITKRKAMNSVIIPLSSSSSQTSSLLLPSTSASNSSNCQENAIALTPPERGDIQSPSQSSISTFNPSNQLNNFPVIPQLQNNTPVESNNNRRNKNNSATNLMKIKSCLLQLNNAVSGIEKQLQFRNQLEYQKLVLEYSYFNYIRSMNNENNNNNNNNNGAYRNLNFPQFF